MDKFSLVINLVFILSFSFQLVFSIKCSICEPDANKNCSVVDVNTIKECKVADDKCFIAYYNNTTYRGCAAILDPTWTNVMKCSSENCNLQEYPLSCYTCRGEDCQSDMQKWPSTVCPIADIAMTNCYINVTNIFDVDRGCLIGDKCNGKECNVICNTSNCNEKTFLQCYSCDEAKDPNCRHKPNETNQCLTDMDYHTESCYTCTTDAKIIRTCNPTNEQTDCLSCGRKNCNRQVPISCYVCSSKDNEECARFREGAVYEKKQCPKIADQCLWSVVNNTSYRGCYSETPCENNFCTRCKVLDFCNSGIIDLVRASCHQCDGNEDPNCDKTQSVRSPYCPDRLQDYTTECFAYLLNNHMVRGCTSEFAPNRGCAAQGDKCFKSLHSNSNSFPLYKEFSCSNCNSADPKCFWSQSDGKSASDCKFMFDQEAGCFTKSSTDGKSVLRGCSNATNACDSADKTCITCKGDNCNIASVMQQECIVCDSSVTPNCVDLTNITYLKTETCNGNITYEKRGCYTKRTGSVVARGCIADLSAQELTLCEHDDYSACTLCTDGNNCNKNKLNNAVCLACSSEDYFDCAKLRFESNATRIECPRLTDECVTMAVGNFTFRGCSGDLFCDQNSEDICQRCPYDNCNNNVLPKDCAKCYRCSNTAACDGKQNPKDLKMCRDYKDFCCAYVNDGHIVRGCSGDIYPYQDCIKSGHCSVSDDGENSIALHKNIQCSQCSGEAPDCSWYQTEKSFRNCTFYFYEKPNCFLQHENQTSIRGCGNDENACNNTSQKGCALCHENDCNRDGQIVQSCIQCVSDDKNSPNCAKNAEKVPSTACKEASQIYENRGCFSKFDGGLVTRGCAVSLAEHERNTCKMSKNHCFYCESDGCNTKNIGSHLTGYFSIVLMFGLLTILRDIF